MTALADRVVAIHRAFTTSRLPHAFGGALALAYYAEPRATIDIDVNVFLPVDRYRRVAAVLSKLGVAMPDEDAATRDEQVRAWWDTTPVDLFFSYDPIHEAMRADTRRVPFGATTIPILAPEHLLVAKAVFDRPKDWIDIEQMLIAVDDFDADEATRWLAHLVGDADPRARRVGELIAGLRGRD
ncbi:MAG TPA: hypothetical protein VGB83_08460 [Actinomycetota bacterium]